jgi:transposase
MNGEELLEKLQAQEAEIKSLREDLAQALVVLSEANARIKQLEGQAGKDSHNRSKPPSTNGFKEPVRKTQSLREKSGKKSGGQPGHPGKTLMMVSNPDEIVRLSPSRCSHCQKALVATGSSRLEQIQVFDLPLMRLEVKEYQAEVKTCPNCQHETRAALPDGIAPLSVQYGPNVKALAVYLSCIQFLPLARTCQLLSDLLGTTFSQAAVLAACQKSAQAVQPVGEQIQVALQHSRVLHSDETGFRVGGKRWWLHVACTAWFTYYLAHPKRGNEATEAMDILPHYHGINVHDSLSMYRRYPCLHALCVAHYLRELTYIHEQYQQDWAYQMTLLLRSIYLQVQQAKQEALCLIPEADQQDYRRRYQHLVQLGLLANPPPTERTRQRGAIKKSEPLTLLLRLQEHHDLILRFMTNFEVPFTNNQAETDLRMMKLRQKISGCFRTVAGSATFCTLRSYLATMKKQGVHLLTALASTYTASLLSPPLLGGE